MGSDGDDAALRAELTSIADAIDLAPADSVDAIARLTELSARLERVVHLLIAREVLHEGDHKLLDRLGKANRRQRVLLADRRDKHAVASPPIDCAALLPLCQGRCCSFRVKLDPIEVRDGALRWNLHEPYLLERAADGYCYQLDGDGRCGCYDERPATCRAYDCRQDERVWLDFENRVPAPMPDDVIPRFT